MSIPKIVGIEQEYAAAVAGADGYDPVELSFLLVNSFDKHSRTIWDYQTESPLMDARGFRREGEEAIISSRANYRINNLLPNGARYYVDHAHPEFSTAECLTARDAVAVDRAGELVLLMSAERAVARSEVKNLMVYKNNTDHKGNSYGSHENYLMTTEAYTRLFPKYPDPPDYCQAAFVPFLVSRQVLCGTGKIGSENGQPEVAYQISQRSDFFETVLGGQTTHTRPIMNTRDEPHADKARFSRLHMILGDGNMSEVSGFLKIATTQLVLRMVEDDFLGEGLALEDPVAAVVAISHDPTCRRTVKLQRGTSMTAVEIQERYLERAVEYLKVQGEAGEGEPAEAVALWRDTLDKLARDPMELHTRVDWVIKKWLIERKMNRGGFSFKDPRARRMEILYHDIRRDKGLFYILEAEGKVDRLFPDDRIIKGYVKEAPENTRAYFRSQCLKRYPSEISHANWDILTFDLGAGGEKKVPLLDPTKGTRQLVGDILDRSPDSATLLKNLSS